MDRRVKYTKKIIKDTFIDLLSKKEISKITVSEICKIADINRATFYRYYLDVYDLLEKIQNDFIDDLKNIYSDEISGEYSVYSLAKELLSAVLKEKKLIKILFNTNSSFYFLNKILELAYEKCQRKWRKEVPNINEEDIEYASSFIFNGALGVINFWVKNDFDKDVEEVSKIIEELSYYGTKKFIYGN